MAYVEIYYNRLSEMHYEESSLINVSLKISKTLSCRFVQLFCLLVSKRMGRCEQQLWALFWHLHYYNFRSFHAGFGFGMPQFSLLQQQIEILQKNSCPRILTIL